MYRIGASGGKDGSNNHDDVLVVQPSSTRAPNHRVDREGAGGRDLTRAPQPRSSPFSTISSGSRRPTAA